MTKMMCLNLIAQVGDSEVDTICQLPNGKTKVQWEDLVIEVDSNQLMSIDDYKKMWYDRYSKNEKMHFLQNIGDKLPWWKY